MPPHLRKTKSPASVHTAAHCAPSPSTSPNFSEIKQEAAIVVQSSYREMNQDSFQSKIMAYSGGEFSGPNRNDDQIAKDLRLKLKKCAEKFKKCIEELDEQVEKDLNSKMKLYEENFKQCLEALDEVIVQDLISNLEQYDERFKQFAQELDEAQDDEAIRSAMGKSEKLTREIAGWAIEIAKPQLRGAVIKAFKKEKEASNDSLFAAIEMMIESFRDYVKDRNNAGMEKCDEERGCTLNKLLDRLSEVAQQVIDLKNP